MPQYLLTYIGTPSPAIPEEGQAHMEKYKQWLINLGEAAISPANPIKNTKTINPDGSVTNASTTTMSGYTIIQADNEQAAHTIAKACPFLDLGGTLEVSELIQMDFN